MPFQYIDPHNEGTFVINGKRYYLTQLYGKKLIIAKPVTFYPTGPLSNGKAQTFSSGLTLEIYSSGHMNGKIVLFFDVPNVPPEKLQYYCFLDTAAFLFPSGMTEQGTVDEKEFILNQEIQQQIEYSKLDFAGKIWAQIKPFVIPAAAGLLLWHLMTSKNG